MAEPNLTKITVAQERLMLRAFNRVLADIRDNVTLSEVVRALEAGNVDAVVKLLNMNEATWEPMYEAVREAYRTGGITGAEQVGPIPTPDGNIVPRFNMAATEAVNWLERARIRLVSDNSREQIQMVRSFLVDGLAAGINPRQVALDLVGRVNPRTKRREGGIIGMTPNQAVWNANARRQLENLDSDYFNRALRDKRFDAMIKRAIENGTPLSQTQIDRIINRMQDRTLKYRGDVIARTEQLNALRAAQHESMGQAAEAGEVDRRDVKRDWDATGDSHTRIEHLRAERDNKGVPMGTPFIVAGEQLMYPGDSSLGASEANTIQCRCRERFVIDFFGKVKRIRGFGG